MISTRNTAGRDSISSATNLNSSPIEFYIRIHILEHSDKVIEEEEVRYILIQTIILIRSSVITD